MWNLLNLKQAHQECEEFRDALEGAADVTVLPVALQKHLDACMKCRVAEDAIFATRAILRDLPSRAEPPAPWFTPRVMAAIAAKESELRQSLEAWAAVPRLAARLTWVSALALLLVTTWLYESPKSAQKSSGQTTVTVESLFDSPQSSAPDDILPVSGRGQ